MTKKLVLLFLLLTLLAFQIVSVTPVSAATLQDSYNTGDTTETWFEASIWEAQTFVATSDYTITHVKVKVFQTGYTDSLYAKIRATSGGLPTGGDLASGSISGSEITQTSPGAWYTISLGAGTALTNGVTYAIVLYYASGSYWMKWRRDAANGYASGSGAQSTNSGSTWTALPGDDFMFETYSGIFAPAITTSAAIDVGNTQATLPGNVTFVGGENSTVTVYWGDDDAGTVAGNWDNSSAPTSPSQPQGIASFYKRATGLSPGTTYYFRAAATNSGGTTWASSTRSFATTSSTSIDVGISPGNYGSYTQGRTVIDLANRANATGFLTSVQIYLYSSQSAFNLRIGTFYWDSGNTYVCRDSTTVPYIVLNNGVKTISGISLSIQEGDYIGLYTPSYGVKRDNSSGTATADILGEYIDPSDSASYTVATSSKIALYGIGVTDAVVPPSVYTSSASLLTNTSVLAAGVVSDLGGAADVDTRGFVYDTDSGAPYAYDWHEDGSFTTGAFTATLSSLTPNTTYYYKSYATNSAGTTTSYDEQSFTTYNELILYTAQTSSGGLGLEFYGNVWRGNTFTPSLTHRVTSMQVKFRGYWAYSPTLAEVHIRATSGGLPTGADLITAQTSIAGIGDGQEAWRTFDLGAGIVLEGGVMYAMLISNPAGSVGNVVYATGNPYAGGESITSSNGGVTWSGSPTADLAFQDWGVPSILIDTNAASGLAYTEAVLNGEITDVGGENATRRGFQYDTDSGAPYAYDTHTDGNYGAAAYNITATGLTPGIYYYYRAYATNEGGTIFGDEVMFQTLTQAPTVETDPASGIAIDKDGVTSGKFNGDLTSIGDDTEADVSFEYGLTVAYGSNTTPVTKLVTGVFDANVPSDLDPGATYHYRSLATNNHGTTTGLDESFTITLPTFTTEDPVYDGLGPAEATLVGNISSLGVATNCYVYFEWGYDVDYGNTTATQTVGSTGDFTEDISAFLRDMRIHYRAVLEIGSYTAYGSDVDFSVAAEEISEVLWYQPIAIVVNNYYSGTVDSGTTTTLVDDALTQANDYWNLALLTIVDTDDDGAPKGETAVVTNFDSASDELQFPALTAALDPGDSYLVEFGVLPDRDTGDGAQDGIITWGTFLTASSGGITIGSLPTITGLPPIDILPEAEGSDWFVNPDLSTTLNNNPFRPFVLMLSDNTTLTELQAWRFLGLAFVLFVTVTTGRFMREHLFIVGLACGTAILILVVLTIWPLWALVFVAGAVGAGVISERTPSL